MLCCLACSAGGDCHEEENWRLHHDYVRDHPCRRHYCQVVFVLVPLNGELFLSMPLECHRLMLWRLATWWHQQFNIQQEWWWRLVFFINWGLHIALHTIRVKSGQKWTTQKGVRNGMCASRTHARKACHFILSTIMMSVMINWSTSLQKQQSHAGIACHLILW